MSERAVGAVAAGEREVEGELVEAVGAGEVAEAAAAPAGPSGVSMASARPATSGVDVALDDAAGAAGRRGGGELGGEVGSGEVGVLEDVVDEGADPGAAGHGAERQGGRRAGPRWGAPALRDVGLVDLGGLVDLDRLGGGGEVEEVGEIGGVVDAGVVGGLGEAGVGGAHPVPVEGPVEGADGERAGGGRDRSVAASPSAPVASATAMPRAVSSAAMTSSSSDARGGRATARRRRWRRPSRGGCGRRRSLGVEGRGPPHHHLVLGPGEGDVEQAQLLVVALLAGEAALLARIGRSWISSLLPTPMARRPSSSWKTGMSSSRAGGASHAAGSSTIGNSRPLAPWMVWTATASASDSRRRRAASTPVGVDVVDLLGEPPGQRGGGRRLGRLPGVEQLGDVAEVAEPALAADGAEQPGGEAVGGLDGGEQAGHAPGAQGGGPLVEGVVDLLPVGVAGGGQAGAVPPEERALGGGVHPAGGRSAARGPAAARATRRRRRSAARCWSPWTTAGMPTAWSAARARVGVAVGAGEDGEVAGADRPPVDGGAGREDAHGLGGEVLGDERRGRRASRPGRPW